VIVFFLKAYYNISTNWITTW